MPGFENHGNTCYFSAAMQCLLHVPQLVNYARDPVFHSALHAKRKNACDLARAFSDLAKDYWTASSDSAVLSCQPTLDAFARVHRAFQGKRHQHDAGEVVLLTLDTLHSALSKLDLPRGQPIVKDHPIPFRGDMQAWQTHSSTCGHSMITEIFQGQQCNTTSDGKEHFFGLVLEPRDTLDKALTAHLETHTFSRLPLVLVASLSKSDAKQYVAYDATLTVPENDLMIEYTLFAVLLHHGTAEDGHWTALCRLQGSWRHFDDATVTPVANVNDIVQRNAIMLFYIRRL